MNLEFLEVPVNKASARVTSQVGCSDDLFVTRCNIIQILNNLHKRRKHLKSVLGMNKQQLKNRRVYRRSCKYTVPDKAAFDELLESGLKIQEFEQMLKTIKEKLQ